MTVPVRFDWAEITDGVVDACKADVSLLYRTGAVKQGVLAHQTTDVLFSQESPVWNKHWELLRDTFAASAKNFISGDFKVKAWCFASFPNVKNLQWAWHDHPNAVWSAVLYLSLPCDRYGNLCFTTEFLQPDGKSLFVEPKTGVWFMFPGAAVHRNGFWDYESMSEARYCIAASALKNQ